MDNGLARKLALITAAILLGVLVSRDFFPAIFVSLAAMIVIVGLLFGLALTAKKNTSPNISIYLLTAIVCIASIFVSYGLRLGLNKRKGKAIIEEIENFRAKQDRYPEILTEIGYEGKKFDYFRSTYGDSYTLKYDVDNWHWNVYDSDRKEWMMLD